MDRIVQKQMESFLSDQQIEEKEQSKQFELFAAYCAVEQHYTEDYTLLDIVTAEGGDCGIDAIAIIVNGTMITSMEEIDDLLKVNKSLFEVSFIFVQAKTSSSFNYGDMGTFGTGVKDFFANSPQMVQNASVKEKSKLAEHIFSNAKYIKRKPVCYLYYVTTGKWEDDQNCTARMEIARKDLLDLSLFDEVKYIPVGADLLHRYYRKTVDANETNIILASKVLLPDIKNVRQSYLGYIDCAEYFKLITGDNGEIRKSVFCDNVRDYQGDNSVNHEMAETIRNAPVKFVLFNNGVTVICKKLSNTRDCFTLTDYQIVNGCQTSHVLFDNRDSIKDGLQIPIKLIETDDDETVNQIIKATNRQTQVSDEQLIALNEFHRKLEEFYSTFEKGQRLYYERRSKQYSYRKEIEKVRIVSIGTQIKSVASMFYDEPHLASRYYGRLLNKLKDIFSDKHKLIPYYTCAYTLYRLEYMFRNKMVKTQYRKFRYHILMMLKYSIAGGAIPKMGENKMEVFCEKILQVVDDNSRLEKEVEKVIQLIDENVEDINSTESTKAGALVETLKKACQDAPDRKTGASGHSR